MSSFIVAVILIFFVLPIVIRMGVGLLGISVRLFGIEGFRNFFGFSVLWTLGAIGTVMVWYDNYWGIAFVAPFVAFVYYLNYKESNNDTQ